jgi:hypothetical protein
MDRFATLFPTGYAQEQAAKRLRPTEEALPGGAKALRQGAGGLQGEGQAAYERGKEA